jgi:hypothetical protein
MLPGEKEWPRPVPSGPHVSVAAAAQPRLESIVRAHSTPQGLSVRGQWILRAAAPDHPSHLQGAQARPGARHPVGRWRRRYLAPGLGGLQEAPRPGRPRRGAPSQRLAVRAMAPRTPAPHHCPATRGRLDDWGAALWQRRPWPRRRARRWRMLEDADRQPPRSGSGLNRPAPDGAAQAPPCVPSPCRPDVAVSRGAGAAAPMHTPGGRCLRAPPPRNPWPRGNRQNASTSTSVMAPGCGAPRLWGQRVRSGGRWAKHGPVPLLRPM